MSFVRATLATVVSSVWSGLVTVAVSTSLVGSVRIASAVTASSVRVALSLVASWVAGPGSDLFEVSVGTGTRCGDCVVTDGELPEF